MSANNVVTSFCILAECLRINRTFGTKVFPPIEGDKQACRFLFRSIHQERVNVLLLQMHNLYLFPFRLQSTSGVFLQSKHTEITVPSVPESLQHRKDSHEHLSFRRCRHLFAMNMHITLRITKWRSEIGTSYPNSSRISSTTACSLLRFSMSSNPAHSS